jgi:hypothetical protein
VVAVSLFFVQTFTNNNVFYETHKHQLLKVE